MLTTAQLTTLAAAISAETDPGFVTARTLGQTPIMRDFLNGPSAFVVWRTNVTSDETGDAWIGNEIDSMSALNMQRLQLLLASSRAGVFDMSRPDRRDGFEKPFGGTDANPGQSRLNMRAVWRRFATRVEALFATGTGTSLAPGALVWEGSITDAHISAALGL